MNGKRICIIVAAIAASAVIVWHDLPIEFPGIIPKVLMLLGKLFIVVVAAVLAFMFSGGKKRPS